MSSLDDDDLPEPLALYPPVVAVVVTRNPGPWFDDTLGGDGGAGLPRPHGPRRRLRLRRRPHRAGRRAPAAGRSCAGSTRTPASPRPPTRRCGSWRAPPSSSSATTTSCSTRARCGCSSRRRTGRTPAIVRPKLVSADDPKVLLDVGRSIDRFGVRYTGIEPGEFDQEQHDGVRDVFYVTTATMLVRVDLFTQLGGFDPDDLPGRRGPRPLLAGPARRGARAGGARRPGRHREAAEEPAARRPANESSRRRRARESARPPHLVLVADARRGSSRSASSWIRRGARASSFTGHPGRGARRRSPAGSGTCSTSAPHPPGREGARRSSAPSATVSSTSSRSGARPA